MIVTATSVETTWKGKPLISYRLPEDKYYFEVTQVAEIVDEPVEEIERFIEAMPQCLLSNGFVVQAHRYKYVEGVTENSGTVKLILLEAAVAFWQALFCSENHLATSLINDLAIDELTTRLTIQFTEKGA